NVSVATTRTPTAESSALAAAIEHAMQGSGGANHGRDHAGHSHSHDHDHGLSLAAEREGSIVSRVEIAPTGIVSPHRGSQTTIGPCLLACRDGQCMPSSCCPGEAPIKVVPGPGPGPASRGDHQ
ncbi:hypothetical protein LPJ61_002631, partial [Coemansia biformis]